MYGFLATKTTRHLDNNRAILYIEITLSPLFHQGVFAGDRC
jgi:hypothetical protein